jgi:hypothetical protein
MTGIAAWIVLAVVVILGVVITVYRHRSEVVRDKASEREFRRGYEPLEAEGGAKQTLGTTWKLADRLHGAWRILAILLAVGLPALSRSASPEKKVFAVMAAVGVLLMFALQRNRRRPPEPPPADKPLSLFEDDTRSGG